jgi:Gas vesicle synthesis protein GvpL/GvpF
MSLGLAEPMTESEPKASKQNNSVSVGYYVYCVAEIGPVEKLISGSIPVAIEEGTSLELVSSNSLAAVVSCVPLSDYGDEGLAERLDDAAWTAIRAMRHEQVVEHFAKHTSVVPLRFGTIYLDRSGIGKMLREKGTDLTAIIHRLKDREEWGINVYCDRAVLLEIIAEVSPRLREMAESAKQASPGQSYLMQKKIEALRVDEVRAEIERCANEIEEKLKLESVGATKLRVLKVETTEYGELKAKSAFLVERQNFDNFQEAAEELAQEMQAKGIRIELTGPWPPYNFATS